MKIFSFYIQIKWYHNLTFIRIIYFILVILLFSCSDSEQDISCVPLVFDKDLYHELDHFGIDLIEYDLNDNCLKVRLGFSGCSSDHTFDLMSQGIETRERYDQGQILVTFRNNEGFFTVKWLNYNPTHFLPITVS